MNTFAPSPLSLLLTPELSQDASPLAIVGGQQSNNRLPLYRTCAEESVAPFIARNMSKVQVDPKRYMILPGGGIVYEPGEQAKLGQIDLTKFRGAESQGRMSTTYRVSRHTVFSGVVNCGGDNK